MRLLTICLIFLCTTSLLFAEVSRGTINLDTPMPHVLEKRHDLFFREKREQGPPPEQFFRSRGRCVALYPGKPILF